MHTFRVIVLLGIVFISACTDDSTKLITGTVPAKQTTERTPGYSKDRNVYFGDTHVHTRYSFDAYLLGTETSPDEAYRYAKGEAITDAFGYEMKLREPLDFFAVTDHGRFLGMVSQWADPSTPTGSHEGAAAFHGINEGDNLHPYSAPKRVMLFRESGGKFMVTRAGPLKLFKAWLKDYRAIASAAFDYDAHLDAWARSIDAAEVHYEPGEFTTFIAYEWTIASPAPERASYHRNVIFEGSQAPLRPFTAIDSTNPEDLWAWMQNLRDQGADSIAILHNSNQSNGQGFRQKYWDGRPIDRAYSETRMKNEPILELAQIKGASETHPRLSPNDEWANYEILNTRKGSITRSSRPDGSYARQALIDGLTLETEGRGNPFKIGFIGSSDTHNAAPSFDESNYFGVAPISTSAENRGSVPMSEEYLAKTRGLPEEVQGRRGVSEEAEGIYSQMRSAQFSSSAMAAVWAEENTRESIFSAMRRKETYATSGNRIRLRFFGGDGLDELDLEDASLVSNAYERAVPMGGDYTAENNEPPQFLIWAKRDDLGAPLQRVQVIKGWYDSGYRKQPEERVYDVACSDGLGVDPATHRCPDNGATVDLSDCSTNNTGASELKTVWTDPEFEPGQDAVYYVRVLENPTCRWSTWDAIRAGVKPREGIAQTIQERAWSSPIWYQAKRD